MQKPFVFSSFRAKDTLLDGTTLNPGVSFYGDGLSWQIDTRSIVSLAHTGGLPGYGSHFRFLPDYGVGIFAFANRTYAPAAAGCLKAINLLIEHVGLKPRTVGVSSILDQRTKQVAEMITHWDPKLEDEIVADNFFLDKSREDWIILSKEVLDAIGTIQSVGPIIPENQLRGTFQMVGKEGRVNVHFTLTPERVPKVQELNITKVPNP